ncbi:hypothetical protein GW17_00052264 [Ensete ventricosum]|nr:hypothetical protein GW17_00052264 [Ensete ventricosum]
MGIATKQYASDGVKNTMTGESTRLVHYRRCRLFLADMGELGQGGCGPSVDHPKGKACVAGPWLQPLMMRGGPLLNCGVVEGEGLMGPFWEARTGMVTSCWRLRGVCDSYAIT